MCRLDHLFLCKIFQSRCLSITIHTTFKHTNKKLWLNSRVACVCNIVLKYCCFVEYTLSKASPDWHSTTGDRLHLLVEGGSPQRTRAGCLHRAEPSRGASNSWQPSVEHVRLDREACLDQLGQPGHLLGKELLHWGRRGHAKSGVTLNPKQYSYIISTKPYIMIVFRITTILVSNLWCSYQISSRKEQSLHLQY